MNLDLRTYTSGGVLNEFLPDWNGIEYTEIDNDSGSLSFDYDTLGVNYGLIKAALETGAGLEIGLHMDGVEIPGSRAIIRESAGTRGDPEDTGVKFNGVGYLSRLKEIRVYPKNWPLLVPVYHDFVAATAGTVMGTLLSLAAVRGTAAATAITRASFTSTTDSNGAAWTKTINKEFKQGDDLYVVLQWLIEAGACDVRMVGRDLRLYNPGTAGTDLTTGATPTILRVGRDISDAPHNVKALDLASVMLIEGDDETIIEVVDATAVANIGRIEAYASESGVVDSGTLSAIAQALIDQTDHPRMEVTHGLTLNSAGPLPITNYKVADYVYSETDGTLIRYRVKQITLTASKDEISGAVTLNDRFEDVDVELQRAVDRLRGGSVSDTSTPVTPTNTDYTIPNAPASPTLTSATYIDGQAITRAQATFSWAAVTGNTDGSVITDLDHYEVTWKYVGDANNQPIINTGLSTATHWSPVRVNVSIQASVKAVDKNNHYSAASSLQTITTASDTTPPPTPSTPVVTERLGTLRIFWDGLGSAAQAMPADFDRVDVHLSTVNGFTPSTATQLGSLNGAGAVIASGLTVGTTYYAVLVSVDRSGNVQPTKSAQGTGIPKQVTGLDILNGSIGYDALGFKDMDNLVADGSFENTGMDAQRTMAAAWSIITSTTADAFHGTRYARVNGATNPSTTRDLFVTGINDVRFGDQIWVRVAYRRAVGSNGTFKVMATETDSAGAQTFPTILSLTSTSGSWVEASGYYTPGATIEKVKFSVQLAADSTAGIQEVDAIEIRHVTGTALIMDAAISNAKIQNLAVDDAKIANLDGGKINAQSITAEEVFVGVLGKQLVANPSFEDPWGWVFGGFAGGSGQMITDIAKANSGSRVAQLTLTDNVTQAYALSDYFAVKPNINYSMGAYFFTPQGPTIDGVYIRPVWYDAAKALLFEATGDPDLDNQPAQVTYSSLQGDYLSPGTAAFCRYKIYWSAPNGVAEIQTVTEGGTGLTSFTLTFAGQTTAAIAAAATPAQVQTALEALSNIAPGDVVVTGDGLDEVQTITEGGAGLVTFTLTFTGQTTTAIAAAATAATVQTALEALSNIAPGDVLVSGDPGGPYMVVFQGVYSKVNVAQMTATPTGGTGTVTIATVTGGAGGPYRVVFQGAYVDTNVAQMTATPTGGTGTVTVTTVQEGAGGSDLFIDNVSMIELGLGGSQLSSTGLKVWDMDGQEVIDLSSRQTGFHFEVSKDGESLAGIDETGGGTLQSLDVVGSLTVQGQTREEWDYDRPWGVRAYGARTGQSAGVTVETAFLEIQGDLVVGRQYRIFTNSVWVANATFETDTVLRYTKGATPGAAAATPGTSSTLLTQARAGGSLTNTTCVIGAYYAPAGNIGEIFEHRFVLTFKPAGGGTSNLGTTLHPLFLTIEDVGPDRGDVGIDRSGGVTTKKDYTKTYVCNGSATYDGSGNSIGGSTANQGYYSGTNGNQRSLIAFPSVTADLSGATVKKVEVYLYFNHWYNNSGGTAIIGTHQYTATLPSSMSLGGNTLEDLIRSSGWPKPGGRWVTLPSSTHANWISGVARGIILGPGPSTSHLYYGKADGNNLTHEPQLRITYNK